MILKVTGDTHGEKVRMLDYIELHKQHPDSFDKLLICGDFGYIFRGNKEEERFLDRVEINADFDILFIDGNHENFPEIYKYPIQDWCGGKVHRIRNNIYHLMRGEIYTINDKKLFTFGGGYSIDKEWRLSHEQYGGSKCWWKEEFPTQQEIDNAFNNLEKNNWKVDYIFSHSAPTNVLPMIQEFFISSAKAKIDIVNSTLEEIRQKAEFKHWYLGHYHGEKTFDNFSLLYNTSKNIEL